MYRTRHGRIADDSVMMSVVIPKTMRKRIDCLNTNGRTFSDVARECMEIGIEKCERRIQRRRRSE